MTSEPDKLRESLRMDLIPQFTDDYIDEWVKKSNNIDGLHKIIDDFADQILKLISSAELSARIDELENVMKISDNAFVGNGEHEIHWQTRNRIEALNNKRGENNGQD